MKLKYYLRGIGIGVFVTTIIFMVLISIHKNDFKQESTRQQETEAKTVAQAETETAQAVQKNTAGDTETKAAGTEHTDTEKTAEKNKTGTAEKDKTGTEATEKNKTGTEAEADVSSQNNAAEKNASGSGKTEEKVRFEIGGGEYSDVICQRLQKEGIIDDAEAFNKYLIQRDYDDLILPGVYDIPKGADYEEISALLTTKVEEETAQ